MAAELIETVVEHAAHFGASFKDTVKCVDTDVYLIYDDKTGAFTDKNTRYRLKGLIRTCGALEPHYRTDSKKVSPAVSALLRGVHLCSS